MYALIYSHSLRKIKLYFKAHIIKSFSLEVNEFEWFVLGELEISVCLLNSQLVAELLFEYP